jgi:hypothetical protein
MSDNLPTSHVPQNTPLINTLEQEQRLLLRGLKVSEKYLVSVRESSLIPCAVRTKSWVCDRSLVGIATGAWVTVVNVMCCQVEVSATS